MFFVLFLKATKYRQMKIQHLQRYLLFTMLLSMQVFSQQNIKESTSIYDGLTFRSIGPAFMSVRIAAIAIHPKNENIWYVGAGSGGVWKTLNSGTTWTPIFDNQSSFAIGALAIDPQIPTTIWVGTGEDVGGRHIAYGDGIYRSKDAGKTWQHMGLKNSQHISKIIIHPNDSNIIWVAAQGPLWNKGDDRGLYKSIDGGKTWNKTLGNNEWTGVTEIAIDPTNPNILYAATWDRHRTVAAYMGGGPGSGLHKSTDGGETWIQLSTGLPSEQMGKIGLAISHFNPTTLYAAIELPRRTGGVFKSTDGGNSWAKQSNTVTGGTGPHYYQELYTSPHHPKKLYLMDNNLQISEDGGKTFYRMNEKNKHGDNHAIAFRKNDPNYLLVGSDGGLYESFDLTKTWKYIDNLPLTQFYKLAVDDAEPFYNIYGGTQDNSTEGGPSRTDNVHGIQNSDWKVVLNWDGHQPATEPGNPNIIYGERQQGTLSRIDIATGEVVDIQPQAGPNDPHERYNWDAPILVSPHNPTTLYFASYRVWKSTNRGDTWTAISGDLTKNQNRIELPILGKKQSWDAAWDVYAMSNYNTITSLAESPIQKGLLYVGTDDGIIQVSENDGATWKKIPVGTLPGVPATAFVNDIRADLFDANTVYVSLDNHKYGDFSPYLLKSTDKGTTWKSIASNIPNRTLIWRTVQDHIVPNLIFAATEFGIYVTINGGASWDMLTGGVPTISFRDITIQRRENDLVGASFGRGFYILDDIAPLRALSSNLIAQEATLFEVRDAWWYIPRPDLSFDSGKGSQGDSHFVAPNPDFGALFTYYLKEVPQTKVEKRKEKEGNLSSDIPFPGYDALEAETRETNPKMIFAVTNKDGAVIRRIITTPKKGINRINWDLRLPAPELILQQGDMFENDMVSGLLAPPGIYTVTMYLEHNGVVKKLSEPISFNVKPLREGSLESASPKELNDFLRSFESLSKEVLKMNAKISKAHNTAETLQFALQQSEIMPGAIDTEIVTVRKTLQSLESKIYGNTAKREIGEKTKPTIDERMFTIYRGIERSTYGPTPSHKKQLQLLQGQVTSHLEAIKAVENSLQSIQDQLEAAGAPYIPH